MTQIYRTFRVSFEVAAPGYVEACEHARDLVKPGVALTVRAHQGPAPSARGMLATGAMQWSVTVPAMLAGDPCELMLAFDPNRRRGVVLLMVNEDQSKTTVATPVYLGPQALDDIRSAIAMWPEDIIARMVTEDVLCGCAPRCERAGAADE